MTPENETPGAGTSGVDNQSESKKLVEKYNWGRQHRQFALTRRTAVLLVKLVLGV